MLTKFLPLRDSFAKSLRFASSFSVTEALKPCLDPEKENLRLRRQLALSYRLLDRLELNEGACNHLTVMAPMRDGSGKEVMLLAPGGNWEIKNIYICI